LVGGFILSCSTLNNPTTLKNNFNLKQEKRLARQFKRSTPCQTLRANPTQQQRCGRETTVSNRRHLNEFTTLLFCFDPEVRKGEQTECVTSACSLDCPRINQNQNMIELDEIFHSMTPASIRHFPSNREERKKKIPVGPFS
jgi:hypothetical protein